MATINMAKALGYDAPFEGMGITEDDYVPLNEVEGKKVCFIGAKPFENDKGRGVYIAIQDGERKGYTTTHAVGLVDAFSNVEVQNIFDSGDVIEGTIKQKVSKKTGNRYFMVE